MRTDGVCVFFGSQCSCTAQVIILYTQFIQLSTQSLPHISDKWFNTEWLNLPHLEILSATVTTKQPYNEWS